MKLNGHLFFWGPYSIALEHSMQVRNRVHPLPAKLIMANHHVLLRVYITISVNSNVRHGLDIL